MHLFRVLTQTLVMLFIASAVVAQKSDSLKIKKDSLRIRSEVTGLIGATNNGISIIPTFSLNAPALNVLFSVRRNRFSFDPDVRLTFDGKRGGMVFWFRYRLLMDKKFTFHVGAHPAYNLQTRKISENGTTTTITQARRFLAYELVPNYRISDHVSVGMYYLTGYGLQKDGPKRSHFLTINTNLSNLKLGDDVFMQFTPQFYYLKLNQEDGFYYTHTVGLVKKGWPFLLQSTVNKEIKTNITGSKKFQWNVTLLYTFNRKYGRSASEDIFRVEDQITEF
jgi:hypothetical protein